MLIILAKDSCQTSTRLTCFLSQSDRIKPVTSLLFEPSLHPCTFSQHVLFAPSSHHKKSETLASNYPSHCLCFKRVHQALTRASAANGIKAVSANAIVEALAWIQSFKKIERSVTTMRLARFLILSRGGKGKVQKGDRENEHSTNTGIYSWISSSL